MTALQGKLRDFANWTDHTTYPDDVQLQGAMRHLKGRAADVAPLFAGLDVSDPVIGHLDVLVSLETSGHRMLSVNLFKRRGTFSWTLNAMTSEVDGFDRLDPRSDADGDIILKDVGTVAEMISLIAGAIDRQVRTLPIAA